MSSYKRFERGLRCAGQCKLRFWSYITSRGGLAKEEADPIYSRWEIVTCALVGDTIENKSFSSITDTAAHPYWNTSLSTPMFLSVDSYASSLISTQ